MSILRREIMGTSKGFPYDTQIEYLESTGTLYIDTDVQLLLSTDIIQGEFYTTYPSSNAGTIFGATDGTSEIACVCNTTSSTKHIYWKAFVPSGDTAYSWDNPSFNKFTVKYDSSCSVLSNGSSISPSSTGVASSQASISSSIYLFARNGVSNSNSSCRCYSFKIIRGGIPIIDLIPVRVGSVGYMYDKVSKQLFGNAGTGSFILGNDIVPVEYLKSTGTQYINTGITGNTITRFVIEGTCVSTASASRQLLGSSKNAVTTFFGCYYTNNWFCRSSGSYIGDSHNRTLIDATLGETNYGTLYDKITNTQLSFDSIQSSSWGFDSDNLILFGGGPDRKSTSASCYNLKLYTASGLVRDFIPVRVGTVGCMYDRVESKLYYNAGSGSFSYGGDIVPVEYLEGTGTQYINTGRTGNLETSVELKFNYSTVNSCVFGNINSTSSAVSIFASTVANGQRFGDVYVGVSYAKNTDYVVISNKTGITVNGNFSSRTPSGSFTTNGNLSLMYMTGSTYSKLIGKLYYCKIYDNGTLVQDLVPVRVGTTGYMYDKVSGLLFGNSGTGSFTFGADIAPRMYISHLELPKLPHGFKQLNYVKNAVCGQALDTGVKFTWDDGIEFDFRQTRISDTGYSTYEALLYSTSNRVLYYRPEYNNNWCWNFYTPYNNTSGYSSTAKKIQAADTNRHIIKVNSFDDNGTIKYEVYVDTVRIGQTSNEVYENNDGSFYLLGTTQAAQQLVDPVEVYGLKVIGRNGNVKLNLIPCRHTTTDKVGFFDTVNRRFITDSFLIGSDEELPSEYEKVDYVVNTQNTSLDTGVSFKHHMGYYLDYRLTEVTETGASYVAGVSYNDLVYHLRKAVSYDNKTCSFYTRYNNTSPLTSLIQGTVADNVRHYCMNRPFVNDTKLSWEMYIDGTRFATNQEIYNSETTYNFILYGINATSTTDIPIEIYSLIIYNSDGTKALEYVPVKKIATGDYGFYDKINRNFITKDWLVTLPSGYTILPYVSNVENGGYVDTEILPSDTLGFKTSFSVQTVNPRDAAFIGVRETSGDTRYTAGIYNGTAYFARMTWPSNRPSVSANTWYNIEANWQDSRTWKIGSSATYSVTGTVSGFTKTIHLLGIKGSSGTAVGRECSLKRVTFTLGTEVIADMIPCISPNDEVGFYDIVRERFFGSGNDVPLIAGT